MATENLELVTGDHPIVQIAIEIASSMEDFAAEANVSPWNACVAMANALGIFVASIDGGSAEAKREMAEALAKIIRETFELQPAIRAAAGATQ